MSKWRHLRHEIRDVEDEIYERSHDEEQHQLISAISSSKVGQVQRILDQGVNPNFLNTDGITPLHYAAQHELCEESLEVLRLLTFFGCPVERRDTKGRVALHDASINCAEFVQVLLDAGTPVNTSDTANITPLMLAAGQGDIDIVNLLLDSGADVHLKDINGKNALHYICDGFPPVTILEGDFDYGKVVYKLLREGLSVNTADYSGRTAFITDLNNVLQADVGDAVFKHVYSVLKILIQGGASLDNSCRECFARTLNTTPNELDRCIPVFCLLKPVSTTSQLQNFLSKSNASNTTFERMAEQLRPSLRTVPSLRHICRSVVRRQLRGQVLYLTQFLNLPQELEQYIMYTECR